MLAGNELNNREWATLVWLGVAIVLVLWWKPLRQPVLDLVRTAALSLFGLLAVGLWAWTGSIAFLGEQAHLWSTDLLKDTVVWAIGPGVVLVFRLSQASKDPKFFRRVLLEMLKLSVLLEFYLNVRVLGFVQELVLLPVATAVALLAQFAGTEQKYRRVKQVFDFILVGIGIALLAYVTITLATSWRQEDPWRDVRELAMPIWLTLGVVPYIYGVSLFFTYQGAFRRIAFSSKDVAAVRRAKLALLLGLNVRLHEVGRFYDPWTTCLTEAHDFTGARRIVRQFRQREPTETAGDDPDQVAQPDGGLDGDRQGGHMPSVRPTNGGLETLVTTRPSIRLNRRKTPPHPPSSVYGEVAPPPRRTTMDHGTAFRLLTEGQLVSLIIEGHRVDGVRVTGLPSSSGGPGYLDLFFPTLAGEPDKLRRVRLDRVELAP